MDLDVSTSPNITPDRALPLGSMIFKTVQSCNLHLLERFSIDARQDIDEKSRSAFSMLWRASRAHAPYCRRWAARRPIFDVMARTAALRAIASTRNPRSRHAVDEIFSALFCDPPTTLGLQIGGSSRARTSARNPGARCRCYGAQRGRARHDAEDGPPCGPSSMSWRARPRCAP